MPSVSDKTSIVEAQCLYEIHENKLVFKRKISLFHFNCNYFSCQAAKNIYCWPVKWDASKPFFQYISALKMGFIIKRRQKKLPTVHIGISSIPSDSFDGVFHVPSFNLIKILIKTVLCWRYQLRCLYSCHQFNHTLYAEI